MDAQIKQYCRELDALAEFDQNRDRIGATVVERRQEGSKRRAIAMRARELALTILSLGSVDDIRTFAELLQDKRYRAEVASQLSDGRQRNNLRIPEHIRIRSREIVLEEFAENVRKGNVFLD